MSLSPGTRFGPYEILSAIGAGGMGEVYKARDTRLDRAVALKVIHPQAAASPEMRERFEREARAISSLDHPNICTLYDVSREADVSFLVMQYLEGETLADRLARAGKPLSAPSQPSAGGGDQTLASVTTASRGPIPFDTTLKYAAEIALALDAAHRRGIVHRDLKPGNVMLTKTGTKLLDFGLAKLAAEDQGVPAFGDMTRTSPLTSQGAILGTLHYMSPEQLEGREVDSRSDIHSFGVLLFEMLSGQRPYQAQSQAGIIAAIIGADPPALPALADPRTTLPVVAQRTLDRLLAKCLAKDPDDRWQSAADLAAELKWIGDERLRAVPESAVVTPSATAQPDSRWRTRERIWMMTTGLAAAAAIGVAVLWYPQPAPLPTPLQFTLAPPDGTEFSTAPGFISASPNGQHIAFATGQGEDSRLWIRSVGTLEARPVPAANGAQQAAWSPDSQSIVFGVGGAVRELKRADLAGGPARRLAELPAGSRAAWSRDGVIVFPHGAAPLRLMRIPDAGGTATPATELNPAAGETAHAWPVFLPDGKRFIFLARNRDQSKSALYLASLDSMERTHLVDVHSMAEVVPGYLLYHRDGTLYAHPFDEVAAKLTGTAVPIVEDVQFNPGNGRAAFATSRTGLLVYRTGEALEDAATLSWLDRSGKVVGTIGQPAKYFRGALSPVGPRYVVPVEDAAGGRDLVMIETERNVPSPFTSGAATDDAPLWTNDGEWIVFSSNRKGVYDLYVKNAGGATPERLLYESPEDKYASAFSPDGKTLVFAEGPNGARRLLALPLVEPSGAGPTTVAGEAKPYRVFPNESENHGSARFSPDGKWLAYSVGPGASSTVFVQPFPTNGYREQVSPTRGSTAAWTADGRQIAFVGEGNSLMSVDITPAGNRLRVSAPREFFRQRQRRGAFGFTMDARAEQFLLVVPPVRTSDASNAPLTVIANWPSLLKKTEK
jgi:serine/threonine protein kinase/Tol biopolymer transport system component